MKNRNIKERNWDRREFAYMYRRELRRLIRQGIDVDQRQFVQEVVRRFIPYSPATADIDIWIKLVRCWQTIIF